MFKIGRPLTELTGHEEATSMDTRCMVNSFLGQMEFPVMTRRERD